MVIDIKTKTDDMTYVAEAIFINPYTNEVEKIHSQYTMNPMMLNSAQGINIREMIENKTNFNIKRELVNKNLIAYYNYIKENPEHKIELSLDLFGEHDFIRWTLSCAIADVLKKIGFQESDFYITPYAISIFVQYNVFSFTEFEDVDNLYIGQMTIPYYDKEKLTEKTLVVNVIDPYHNRNISDNAFEVLIIPKNSPTDAKLIVFNKG